MSNTNPSQNASTTSKTLQTRLKLINTITANIHSGMSVDQIITSTIQQISVYFPAYRTAYATLDPSDNLKILSSNEPAGMPSVAKHIFRLNKIAKYFNKLQQGEPIAIEDVLQDNCLAPVHNILKTTGTRALLCVSFPHFKKSFLGLLYFAAPHPQAWSEHELMTLTEIAGYLSVMLKNTHEHTLRKQTEVALQKSEARFRTFVDHATDAFFLLSDNGVVQDVNHQACESLGYIREELIGMTPHDFDTNANSASLKQIKTQLATGEMVTIDTRHCRKDGSVFPVEVRMRPFRQEGRLFIVALARDITKRKQAEEALTLFRSLIDHTQDAIEVVDPESGRFLDVNEQACISHGYTREEYLSLTAEDIDPQAAVQSWAVIREKIKESGTLILESQHQRKDGSVFPVEVSIAHIHLHRDYFIAVVRDITKRKQLEEQFLQAQKVDAIGQLAGGISHDFNNFLTVINGYSDLVYNNMEQNDPNRELLADIIECGKRASTLTRQLLAFSRRHMLQPQTININTVLSEVQKLLQRLISENIEMIFVPSFDLSLVKVDPGQFEQAIINLSVNAQDAMPRGGQLTLKTSHVVLTAEDIEYNSQLKPGKHVLITLSDTGQGMDHETQARIFEPFFTTKALGKGTGLGLAMVYGFVEQSQGCIKVESQLDQGTTFKIYLPCAEKKQPSTPNSSNHFIPPKGNETVLLVEDAETVRTMAKLVLQANGYTVLEAQDGHEAISIASQYQNHIDILLTDVIMPRMGGFQLADQLAQTRPNIKTLFMSGYSKEKVLLDQKTNETIVFLNKPFDPLSLTQKVRERLDLNEHSNPESRY